MMLAIHTVSESIGKENHVRILTVCLVLSVLVGAMLPVIPARAQEDSPTFEPADCLFDLPAGQNPDCGYVEVPADHTDPDGPTIRLHVAVFHSRSDPALADPVVYLEGGPGGHALELLSLTFSVYFDPLLDTRDLIIFDQRGTGYSDPALECPEVIELNYDLLDEDISPAESRDQLLLAFQQCRDRLAGEGIDLSNYTSVQNAADVEAVRQALGYEQWNLYGISYGTRLALTVMRDFPASVRSAILDSTVPLEANLFIENPAHTAQAFEVLFQGCAQDAECSAAYPDMEAEFDALVARLDDEPVKMTVTNPLSGESYDLLLNGDALISFLFQSLYSAEIIPMLPRIVFDVRDGDTTLFAQMMGALLTSAEIVSFGMQFAVECGEELNFATAEDLAAAAESYPDLAGYLERSLLDEGAKALCDIVHVPAAAASENEPVISDIPTLILAGEYDPVTPPAWGEQVAANLSHSHFFEFPGLGHGASVSAECAQNILLEFLDDPATAPDAVCIADMTGPDFMVPLSQITLVPYTSEVMGFTGLVPEGWEEVSPGVFAPSLASPYALIQMALPGMTSDTMLPLLLQQLGGAETGTEPSVSTETREANGLVWELYRIEESTLTQGIMIDLAVADGEAGVYAVIILALPGDHDVLYEQVFLPVIDALLLVGAAD